MREEFSSEYDPLDDPLDPEKFVEQAHAFFNAGFNAEQVTREEIRAAVTEDGLPWHISRIRSAQEV